MYNIGDRFVITKENGCCWDVGTVVEVIDIDENDRVYKYNIEPINTMCDDFWLGSNEEIDNVNVESYEYNDIQEWNIDSFARLVASPQQLKYKVGDRFKVLHNKENFGEEFTIKGLCFDGSQELIYVTDKNWYFGDSNTICSRSNHRYNIDNFATLIENEEHNECEECTECTNEECIECANEECDNKYNFTTYGEMQIVGRCYEDVVSILMANGYIVQVEKNDVDDFNKAEFTIIYGKKEN